MSIPVFKENIDHTVYKNLDGNIVPSITTILKIINKPELLFWANSLGYKGNSVTTVLESTAYIGSVVHKMVEVYTTKGHYSIEDMNKRGPAERICIKNAFASFLQFYSEEKDKINILETESQLHGSKCGGTMDLLAEYDEILTLCDYKTSKAFYPTMFLQLAGYDLLLRELKKIEVDQYMVILLDKADGKKAKIKKCNDKDEMELYRRCFQKLVDFYYDWYFINQKYWKKELI